MSFFWHLIVSAGVFAAWWIVLRSRSFLVDTTLRSSWSWSLCAASAWAITWFADPVGSLLSPAGADYAWYLCGVLALCPPISVLGSRRPGNRVWTWFILVPMVLALCWPVVAVRLQGSEFRGLHLETPQLIAFGLVLVMGVGNYCGTRYTPQALLYAGALLALVLACSDIAPHSIDVRRTTRFWATLAIAVSVVTAPRAGRPPGRTRFDRLWFDFFDTFGIVWGRRIQDRVNFIAQKEGWPVRLELDGFAALASIPDPPSVTTENESVRHKSFQDGNVLQLGEGVETRIDHTLRWLLRRFVDPVWIDKRLESEAPRVTTKLSIDS